jgi:hypothetical protein
MNEPLATAKTRQARAAAKADRAQRRELEKSVRWTVPERLRFLWYWFWLTAIDAHAMSGWMSDVPLPSYLGSHEELYGAYEGPFDFPWYAC